MITYVQGVTMDPVKCLQTSFGQMVRMENGLEAETPGWGCFNHPTLGMGVWGTVVAIHGGVVTIQGLHLGMVAGELRYSDTQAIVAIHELVEETINGETFLVWRPELDLV